MGLTSQVNNDELAGHSKHTENLRRMEKRVLKQTTNLLLSDIFWRNEGQDFLKP